MHQCGDPSGDAFGFEHASHRTIDVDGAHQHDVDRGVALVELDGLQPGRLNVPEFELFEDAQVVGLNRMQHLPPATFSGQGIEHLATGHVGEIETVAGQFTVLPTQQVGQFEPASWIAVVGSLLADVAEFIV